MAAPSAPLGPDAARRLLARAAYGARPGEAERVGRLKLRDWLEAQLALPETDAALAAHLEGLRLQIRYARPDGSILDEMRPLATLDAPQAERWKLTPNTDPPIPGPERDRPRMELSVATIARKALAEAQLRERMVEFWHDHFSVSSEAAPHVSVSLPDHDRRIRDHALGNFRALLEATATSPAMLFYLSNRTSRAGAPNENYARELLELHTLGAAAYLGGSGAWRSVPGATEGRPVGYIDADVWEVARALTGWTLANGERVDGNLTLPRTGEFRYVEQWHDGHQKRILGHELEPFAPAMAHGRAALDLAARHPATATHVCTKLARFLIGDPPPQAAVARAAAAFRAHAEAPDQIARTLLALLDGPEATTPAAGRVRRPLDLVAAAARAYAIPLAPTAPLVGALGDAGQRLFGWPSPDGQPVAAAAYLGAAALRTRWFLMQSLMAGSWRTGASPFWAEMAGRPVAEVAETMAIAALGPGAGREVGRTVLRVWAAGLRPANPSPPAVAQIAGWVLAAPAFQAT